MISKKKAAGKSTRGSIKTVTSTKDDAKPPQVLEGIGTLPEHMRLSDDELAVVARLVRTLRHENYWVGPFIEWLLAADDGCISAFLDFDLVQGVLKDFKAFHSWEAFLKKPSNSAVKKYIGHRFFPDRLDYRRDNLVREAEATEEDQFLALVKLWRKDHPAPEPKRMQAPAGHLGREESGD